MKRIHKRQALVGAALMASGLLVSAPAEACGVWVSCAPAYTYTYTYQATPYYYYVPTATVTTTTLYYTVPSYTYVLPTYYYTAPTYIMQAAPAAPAKEIRPMPESPSPAPAAPAPEVKQADPQKDVYNCPAYSCTPTVPSCTYHYTLATPFTSYCASPYLAW